MMAIAFEVSVIDTWDACDQQKPRASRDGLVDSNARGPEIKCLKASPRYAWKVMTDPS